MTTPNHSTAPSRLPTLVPMDAGVEVHVYCFGRVRIATDDVEVELSEDQRRLVASLVAAGRNGLDSSQLYDELFESKPAKSGKQAAVMRVQRLRNKLPTHTLTSGGHYAFDPRKVWVDIWDFERRAADGDLGGALDLWDDPFGGIPDLSMRLDVGREQLRLQRVQLLERLGWQIEPGYDSTRIQDILRELQDNPYNESLTASAVAALYRLGRQTEALDLVQSYRKLLLEIHGLDVGQKLHEIELAVLRQDAVVLSARMSTHRRRVDAPQSSNLAPQLLRDHRRFVGRSDVISSLNSVLSTDAPRREKVALVLGPAGSGKTHTVANVLDAHIEEGTVVRVGASGVAAEGSADQTPFGAILRALPELIEPFAQLVADGTLESARSLFWREIERELIAIDRHGSMTMVLDDMHLADSQSQMVIRHFASAPLPPNLRIIATSRPVEATSTWGQTLAAIRDSPQVTCLELEPLSADELAELVRADHPDEPEMRRDRFTAQLAEISQGNALVASVLSRDAPDGLDVTMLPDAVSPEAGLARHLASRVTSHDLNDLLSVAALIGLEFTVDLLASIVGQRRDALGDLLAEAHRLEICRSHDGESWRFDHLLVVGYFAERLSLLRPILFARLARHPDAPQNHRVRYVAGAGAELSPREAKVMLLDAAKSLQANYAFAEATTALRLCLPLLPDSGSERVAVLTDLANCASRTGALDEAESYRRQAWDLGRAAHDDDAMAQAALAGLPSAEHSGGDPDRLNMLDRLDVSRVNTVSRVELVQVHMRQARACERFDLAKALAESVDPAWAPGDPLGWAALRTEVLMIGAASFEGVKIRHDLATLADETTPGPLRARVRFRELVAALTEQHPDAASTLFDDVAMEIEAQASPRIRWSLAVVEAMLADNGMRRSPVDPDAARQAGVRWGIPDVMQSWGVQHWMRAWMSGDYRSGLEMAKFAEGAFADNLAWKAGAALCHAHLDERSESTAIAARVTRGIRQRPEGLWSTVAAVLLAETAALVNLSDAAAAADAVLKPRSSQAIVLGIGSAYFGPVDRYLGLCAQVGGSADPAPLYRAAEAQATRAGGTRWAQRARENLAAL